MLILGFFWGGCSLNERRNGLLLKQNNKVILQTIQGESYHIHAGKDQKYLAQLEGCQLRVISKRLGKHLWIDEWTIQDAGDGSAPFLGMLERKGLQWVMKDLNSKAIYILEDLEKYTSPAQGEVVLVAGYIVGAHRIKVVSVRVLN